MIHVGLPRGQAGWLVYDPRSRAIRVCADVTFDKTFQTVAPATHTAFSDAVPVHTPLSWHLTSTDLQSSVPANDHYGTPQLGYAEDDPTCLKPVLVSLFWLVCSYGHSADVARLAYHKTSAYSGERETFLLSFRLIVVVAHG